MNVLLPVVIAGGATALNDLVSRGALRPTVIAGTFIYGAVVFLVAELNGELALSFAWVVALTSILLNGMPVFKAIKEGVN